LASLTRSQLLRQLHGVLYHAFVLHGRILGQDANGRDLLARQVELTDLGILFEVDDGAAEPVKSNETVGVRI
jgi:hypothetical protein